MITAPVSRGVGRDPLRPLWLGIAAWVLLVPARASAADPAAPRQLDSATHHSLAGHRFEFPGWQRFLRVVSMRDYNTRVVFLGTMLLGTTAGLVGVFVLLRRRSLVGDVVGHSSLPGVALAFLVMELLYPDQGKSLGVLLVGATLSGLAGVLCMMAILRFSRIKEDAALAIVLGVFFGMGMVLFTVVQNIQSGNTAGLDKFIFGAAASMVTGDVILIAEASVVVLVVCILLFKEFTLLCFDDGYAFAQGWPTIGLDVVLMALVVAVAEIGAQSVGLILVVGLLIIPASAARFWSENLRRVALASTFFGGLSAYLGVLASALVPRLAAGAIIIIVGGAIFALSMLFGARRGILWRILAHWRMERRVGRHDLLRAVYELLEPAGISAGPDFNQDHVEKTFTFEQLLSMRSWTTGRLRSLLASARAAGLIVDLGENRFRLTRRGLTLAHRAARNHRLWELYLITYADIAPSHVDRDADQIEHVLGPVLTAELEQLMAAQYPRTGLPPSPHRILQPAAADRES